MTGHINLFLRATVPVPPSASITTLLLIRERKTNKSSQGLWILLARARAAVLPWRQPRAMSLCPCEHPEVLVPSLGLLLLSVGK